MTQKEKNKEYQKAYRQRKKDCPIYQARKKAENDRYNDKEGVNDRWKRYAKTQYEKLKNSPSYKERKKKQAAKYRERHPFLKLVKAYKKDSKRKNRILDTLFPLDLWTIARKQKLICPISGIRLTSENISIDHKIPIARGGTNSKENLQLVTKTVNTAKNSLTDAEFIAFCKTVAEFNK